MADETTTIHDAELLDAADQLLEQEGEEGYRAAIARLTDAVLGWWGDPRYGEIEKVGEHLARAPDGEVYFRSDKYRWCPDEFVPLKLTDSDARQVLRIYAALHHHRDALFAEDLLEAIALEEERERCEGCRRPARHVDDEGTHLCDDCWAEA
jgi:hypothetical protein